MLQSDAMPGVGGTAVENEVNAILISIQWWDKKGTFSGEYGNPGSGLISGFVFREMERRRGCGRDCQKAVSAGLTKPCTRYPGLIPTG